MKSSFIKVAFAFGVVAACMFGLAACANNGSDGVAATVNGTEIKEQKVTDQIENIRKQSGLEDKDQWGQFLVKNNMTPSSVRDQIIDTLVEQELIKQGAAELGISIEDSELDEYVNKMKANYGNDDEKWNKALEQAGFTESDYRDMIKQSLLEQKVGDHFEKDANLTDEDYVTSANTYASSYNGAKRSSHILFKVDDKSDEAAMSNAKAQAEQVLAQINSGADFAELAKQYSGDTGSAEKGGDVGWDKLNSFVTEYTGALDGLELNQVSGLVESDYGIHIIKCTEVFTAPEQVTSLDQIPEAFQENIKEMAASVKANTAYEEWLKGLKEKADIKKNDMPSGLPYDIDLAPYQEAASSSSESESSESTDENATEEAGSEAASGEEDAGITVESEDGAEVEVENVEVADEGSEASESSSSSSSN